MLIQSPLQPPTALPCEQNSWGKVLPHLNKTWLTHYLFRQARSTYDLSFPYFVLPVKQPSAFTSQVIIKEQKTVQQFQLHPFQVTMGNLESSPELSMLLSPLQIFNGENIFRALHFPIFLPVTFSLTKLYPLASWYFHSFGGTQTWWSIAAIDKLAQTKNARN